MRQGKKYAFENTKFDIPDQRLLTILIFECYMYKASLLVFPRNHQLNWKKYHPNVEQISQNQSNLALDVRVSQFNDSHGHRNSPCIKLLRRNTFHCKTWLKFEKDVSKTN